MALLWMWFLPLFARDLHLPLGSSAIFSAKESLWIEKSKILKAKKKGAQFFLQTKAVGKSLLQHGNQNYQVFVLDSNSVACQKRIEAMLVEYPSLSVEWNQEKLYLRGELNNFEIWRKIAKNCESNSCQHLLQAEIPKKLQASFVQELEVERLKENLPFLRFLPEKNFAIPVGPRQSDLARIREFAAKWGLQVLPWEERLEYKPLIEVQVLISEVRRSSSQALGLLWPSEASGKLESGNQIFENDLPLKLRALEESGEAQILASPSLLIRSGESGEFLAGGEIPFRIANFRTQDVLWKKFGIQLQIQAWADPTGAVEMKILTEVSTPDFSQAVDGLPSLQTHRVQSHINLLQEQALLISGLLREDRSEAQSALPYLSRIPLLGALFKSQNYLDRKSELFLWLRPRIRSGHLNPTGESPLEEIPTGEKGKS
ncbi:MAG: type II and III secretion system protein [Bdellovibrio sp.]